MDGFNYAIASILGAMLVVISMDAYLFFMEVASRRWTSSYLVSKGIALALGGFYLRPGNGYCNTCLSFVFGSGIAILTITSGMLNVLTVALPCWQWLTFWLNSWPMASNLTRFYFDFDEECRTGCFVNLAYKDVETIEADEYERELQSQDVLYTRIDLWPRSARGKIILNPLRHSWVHVKKRLKKFFPTLTHVTSPSL